MNTSAPETTGPRHTQEPSQNTGESHQDATPSNQSHPGEAPSAPQFHTENPAYLLVGHQGADHTEVWASTVARRSSSYFIFRNHEFKRIPVEDTWNGWLDQYKLTNFQASTKRKQKILRRDYIRGVIEANLNRSEIPAEGTARASARRQSNEGVDATLDQAIHPILIVSASSSHQTEPSIHVYLKEHWTISDLFESLTDEVNVRGPAGETVSSIQVTFLWDDKRVQLLRKDRPDDYAIFWEALRRARRQKRADFMENGCEIEMVVRVDGGA